MMMATEYRVENAPTLRQKEGPAPFAWAWLQGSVCPGPLVRSRHSQPPIASVTAGRNTRLLIRVRPTIRAMAEPMQLMRSIGKNTSPTKAVPSVSAETRIVKPARLTMIRVAAYGERPRRRSSWNRDSMKTE